MSRPRKRATDTDSSVYKGGDGRWHGRVTMGLRPDGQVDRKHLSQQSKSDLLRAVRELEQRRDTGDIHKHVLPILGSVLLEDLTTEHLENLYARMLGEGRSTHTVNGVHRVLRSALNEAVRRRRLTRSPAEWARAPRIAEKEIEPLTRDEMDAILRAAERQPRNGARWSVALALGLRQGEALGLGWRDIDLDAGYLHVRHAVKRETWLHGCKPAPGGGPSCGSKRGAECPQRHDGGLMLGETKSKSSKRRWALPRGLLRQLQSQRTVQLQERLAAGDLWEDNDFVFATEQGRPIDPKQDRMGWVGLLAVLTTDVRYGVPAGR